MRLLARGLLCGCLGLALGGCERPRDVLSHAQKTASVPGTGRASAAAEITSAIKNGVFLPGDAVDFVYAGLEEAKTIPGGSGKSAALTSFAGGVLDAIGGLQGNPIRTDGEYEIFWQKVGRLAFLSAEEAFSNQRESEARTLVFAGGTRWQNDAYWGLYSDHDALAAVLLARAGQRDEALRRLRSRNELQGPAAEVYRMLLRGQ